jgi:hypothetical protein
MCRFKKCSQMGIVGHASGLGTCEAKPGGGKASLGYRVRKKNKRKKEMQ